MDNDIEFIWRNLLAEFPFDYEDDLILNRNWRQFDKGTKASEIWKWFDKIYTKGVYYLANNHDKKGEDGMLKKYNFTITSMVSPAVTGTINSSEEYANDVDALIAAQQMCEDRHIRECDIDVNVKYKTDDNETDYKRYYHYHYKDHKIES